MGRMKLREETTHKVSAVLTTELTWNPGSAEAKLGTPWLPVPWLPCPRASWSVLCTPSLTALPGMSPHLLTVSLHQEAFQGHGDTHAPLQFLTYSGSSGSREALRLSAGPGET